MTGAGVGAASRRQRRIGSARSTAAAALVPQIRWQHSSPSDPAWPRSSRRRRAGSRRCREDPVTLQEQRPLFLFLLRISVASGGSGTGAARAPPPRRSTAGAERRGCRRRRALPCSIPSPPVCLFPSALLLCSAFSDLPCGAWRSTSLSLGTTRGVGWRGWRPSWRAATWASSSTTPALWDGSAFASLFLFRPLENARFGFGTFSLCMTQNIE